MSEYCKYCGKKVNKSDNICKSCGSKLKLEDNPITNQNNIKKAYTSNKKKDFRIALFLMIPALIIIVFPYLIFLIFGIDTSDIKEPKSKEEIEEKEEDETITGFYQEFIFNDLIISFSNNYEFVSFEGNNEKNIIKLPITITNIGNKPSKLSPLSYEIYTPLNKISKNINAYFENNIDSAPELSVGKSYTKYIYILYDKDGNYIIKFNNNKITKTVKLEINKNKA